MYTFVFSAGVRAGGGAEVADVTLGTSEGCGAPEYNYAARGCVWGGEQRQRRKEG